MRDKKFGTVGAVACYTNGDIAAATSTGGMTNKKYGRIGDTPMIGSGTYANNKTCAISCTGHGEVFMQAVAAYDVNCLMEYKGLSLEAAMQEVVYNKKFNKEIVCSGVTKLYRDNPDPSVNVDFCKSMPVCSCRKIKQAKIIVWYKLVLFSL